MKIVLASFIVVVAFAYGAALICRGLLVACLNKFQNKRRYSEIDPEIAPLVSKMNETGVIKTIASCEGHICRCSPYVYFETTIELAAAIEQRLRKALLDNEQWMSTEWKVDGHFDDEYKLVFSIYSPQHDDNYWKLWWSLWRYGINRRKLNAELLSLADILEQAILMKLRKQKEPCIDSSANYENNAK